eukprot:1601925-Amphidinium_carterae.1
MWQQRLQLSLPQALEGAVQAVVAAGPARPVERRTLIDIKGLGRPQQLHHPETEFVTWARRTENFVASVMTGARDVLTWAAELDPSTAANAAGAAAEPSLHTTVAAAIGEAPCLAKQLETTTARTSSRFEADQKHVPQLLEDLGLTKGKAVKTPRLKLNAAEVAAVEDSPLLDSAQATVFRSGTMRAAYLGQDRVDIAET